MSTERVSSETVVITERASVKLGLGTAVVIAGGLMSVAASSGIAWYALKAKEDAHEKNVNVHLEENFIREHGVPIGKWDLTPRDEATAKALDGLQRQADYAVKKADDIEAQLNNRKPRWHP